MYGYVIGGLLVVSTLAAVRFARKRELGKIRRDARESIGWLKVADDLLNAVHRAREGAGLSRMLAAASIGGTLLNKIIPHQTAFEELRERGYDTISCGLWPFFSTLIKLNIPPTKVALVEESSRVLYWGENHELAMIFLSDGRLSCQPLALKGDDTLFGSLIQQVAWASGTDLMLAYGGDHNEKQSDQGLELIPLEPAGNYIGEPKLEWYVNRLRHHDGETRSMLLAGPSGAGKSTLGRLIAQAVDGGKTLKVASKALRQCSASDLLDLVRFLKPSVLLLDDLTSLQRHNSDEQMLELLEALHGKARLIIATLMDDNSSDNSDRNYYAGMRPGRIDEVVRVKRPPPRTRREILVHYLGGAGRLKQLRINEKLMKDIVKRCDGLTGAYLKEVAHRLSIHGIRTYKSEIASVVAAAPLPEKKPLSVAEKCDESVGKARRGRGFGRKDAQYTQGKRSKPRRSLSESKGNSKKPAA